MWRGKNLHSSRTCARIFAITGFQHFQCERLSLSQQSWLSSKHYFSFATILSFNFKSLHIGSLNTHTECFYISTSFEQVRARTLVSLCPLLPTFSCNDDNAKNMLQPHLRFRPEKTVLVGDSCALPDSFTRLSVYFCISSCQLQLANGMV